MLQVLPEVLPGSLLGVTDIIYLKNKTETKNFANILLCVFVIFTLAVGANYGA